MDDAAARTDKEGAEGVMDPEAMTEMKLMGCAPASKRLRQGRWPGAMSSNTYRQLIRAERTHRQAGRSGYRHRPAKFPVLKDLDKFVSMTRQLRGPGA